ncbi:MAG: hypothetical protein SGJ09_05160 [Phycisphaerae bacterium]|nr:hypothetical protein [Phycisphaerae bacterium]
MSTTLEHRLDEHCRHTVLGLRSALLELYHSVEADITRPQEVARRFGLNKNLTWKIARILQAQDALEAVPLIPGSTGLEILLEAMGNAGAPIAAVERVRAMALEFDRMIESHADDRAGFELLLDSMGGSRPLEIGRKLAFRGNTAIWGLQARVRLTAQFLAPNAQDPSLLDIALVCGLLGVRRLRPVQRWPLFRFARYNDDASPLGTSTNVEPLEPSAAEKKLPWLMSSWCSPPYPPLERVNRADDEVHELTDGPIGRTGEFSCMFGFVERGTVPRYADEQNRTGEPASAITLPIETLLFDLFVHRSLLEARRPELCVYGRPSGTLSLDPDLRVRQLLPFSERLVELGGSPPQVATPLVPGYEKLVATAFERAGWNPRDFFASRLVLEYPPMPSTVVLRYELPERPR